MNFEDFSRLRLESIVIDAMRNIETEGDFSVLAQVACSYGFSDSLLLVH